jgi:EAL domain-containing protein (putative c-di-GMP-specific phosphodiesterase class I)
VAAASGADPDGAGPDGTGPDGAGPDGAGPDGAAPGGADPGWPSMVAAALAGGVVSVHYQPVVDLARGTVVGYEALARFAGFAEKRPDRWFAAARDLGRHVELEALALRAALEARSILPRNSFLAVNVSPDLLSAPAVRAVWSDEGDLGGVVVELTEQVRIESYTALEGDLAGLRAAGALIAVDDAGAGYAGLRHLLALRPSIIKLDRELVEDIDLDEAKLALVEMVGTFAGRVDAWLLAEGVERDGELDALVSLGVPLAQGYLLARPGPPWPQLDLDIALRLASRGAGAGARVGRGSAGTVVRDLVETVPTALSPTAAALLFGDHFTHTVVIIDGQHRPQTVYTPETAHLGLAEAGLRVNLDTPVSQALVRAITRENPRRYEPLMCTDNAGRFIGVVRMERLIHAAIDTTG